MNYDAATLKVFVEKVMKKAGLQQTEAELFADSLVFADLRGIGSHGITRLRTYARRVECGVINPRAVPRVIGDAGALIHVDGENGIGVSTAMWAMNLCIERARETGCCFALVKNGNHFGTGAYYSMYAAKQNMIGFIISNSEAGVVPAGGTKPMLGTNPLSVAMPAGRHEPVVLDMATSIVARGRVVLAQKEGRTIPEGWCVDKNGVSTTDPTAALNGAMLPFGGVKGYAISLLIDLICSSFAGALNGRTTPHFWDDFNNPQNVGHMLGAFDIAKICPISQYAQSMDSALDEFKACPPSPGVEEVMIPGEPESRTYIQRMQEGIPLSEAVVKDLIGVGEQYGVPHPF